MAYNIADLFEHAVDLFPERLAVACGDGERTYAELDQRANRLAHHLAAHGVVAGSHVGMCMRNRIEAVETMLAVYKLRAVLININFRYTASEVRYVLDNADVVAVLHERQFAPQVDVAVAGTQVGHVVAVADESDAPAAGCDYETALAEGGAERDFCERSGDDLYILYTGGTTGMPKGVMWRHEDVWRTLGGGINFVTGEALDSEWAQAESGNLTGGLRRICLAPLIHGNAQWAALMALFAGDTVILLPQFDAAEVWATVERRQANLIVLIGDAMARPMIEAFTAGRYDVSSLFAVSSSAALFSQSVKSQYLEALPNVVITDAIGSSETGFMGLGLITKDSEQGGGGPRVSAGRDTIVIGLDGKPLPPGSDEIGRLARGGHIPLGYYKDPAKTAELFIEVDGTRYSVPGDFARHEADGSITLLGRGNTCVNTGGEKVFPEEVEATLMAHPDVFDVLVVGVPDERLGQRVAAVIEPRPGTAPSAEELITHARKEIAGYKVPRSIWLVDRVHRLATGKADYRWAAEYATAHPEEDACAQPSATS
ncbi:acyl-CoA synthetase [Jatrophihabitans cynanchi]|uniref:Acyl-CoA synthetase n=1 Tax=Jatrophihabitans cynanchi TaxID=2944128 RepID=A0ABY7JYF6_9ACTN|nr:acyl-CoA synthetase [Jatrophihabitans sp. SB3-54]WAX57020.1 acyl-CoA synthetase [Jatrophihabitans sp. SB3-54]